MFSIVLYYICVGKVDHLSICVYRASGILEPQRLCYIRPSLSVAAFVNFLRCGLLIYQFQAMQCLYIPEHYPFGAYLLYILCFQLLTNILYCFRYTMHITIPLSGYGYGNINRLISY